MYVCMCIFRPGGRRPRKVSYWSTGRAELNYLQLLSHPNLPRTPAMSTRINGERRTPFPPSGTCPTRSQPYGSFKHIVLDVKAGNPRKVLMQRLFHLVHPACHRHNGALLSRGHPVSGNRSLSSLEFSCADRSISFPYPKAGNP